jgi:CPA2 family monovalent cation:H+ antiporter-2
MLRRSFIKVYAKAQVALLETLAQPPDPRPGLSLTPMQPLLREADLEAVAVPAGAPAAGRMIRELALRTRTGASIVGIERNGANIINPGPDEELQVNDQVLLLGTRAHIDAARIFFKPAASAESTGPRPELFHNAEPGDGRTSD